MLHPKGSSGRELRLSSMAWRPASTSLSFSISLCSLASILLSISLVNHFFKKEGRGDTTDDQWPSPSLFLSFVLIVGWKSLLPPNAENERKKRNFPSSEVCSSLHTCKLLSDVLFMYSVPGKHVSRHARVDPPVPCTVCTGVRTPQISIGALNLKSCLSRPCDVGT